MVLVVVVAKRDIGVPIICLNIDLFSFCQWGCDFFLPTFAKGFDFTIVISIIVITIIITSTINMVIIFLNLINIII